MSQTVAVLGASHKPERYSNQAVRMLREYGHQVIPVTPGRKDIEDLPVAPSLADIDRTVDTLTVYVGPERSAQLQDAIIALKPGRVILNPGTESPELEQALTHAGIPWQHACTLVLLRTGQF
ncbi:MAG: CoA-binding protein [Desulfovibrionales bacterium]|nr:CoA-binding protein [Desulfovibrionales bacterium]